MKEVSVHEASTVLERRRRRLRDLLSARHTSNYNLVNVRLSNVYDWTVILIMAIKKNGKDAVKKAEFKGFFNYEMNSDEKAACKAWVRNEEVVAIEIEDAIASLYKFTLTKDVRSDGYQATMQAHDPKDPNAGLCMSAYAKHWYDALGVLLFKHTQLLKKDWSSVEASPDTEDFG